MSGKISGRLVAAARALTGVSQTDFAEAAGLSLETIRFIEADRSTFLQTDRDIRAITHALDHFGIVIIDESADMGAGVRLKFTRQDTRQIARLEGEGGMARADDAP
jgi:transcriptional regulator with XRE-family HTH domain